MEFLNFLTHIPKIVRVFFVSMLPIVELRGAIPYGAMVGEKLDIFSCYFACVLGNLLPIPFIILWVRMSPTAPHPRKKESRTVTTGFCGSWVTAMKIPPAAVKHPTSYVKRPRT